MDIQAGRKMRRYIENHGGGGTFYQTGEPVLEGFAVSVRSFEFTERPPTGRQLGSAAIRVYPFYLGVWYDTENSLWETSKVIVYSTREEALARARGLGERYIYDLAADEAIAVTTPPPGPVCRKVPVPCSYPLECVRWNRCFY